VHPGAQAGQPAAPAKVTAVAGTLLQRTAGPTWQSLRPGDEVRAEKTLVGLPRADLLSRNGAVQLTLLADVGQRGPFPVLEAGVVLHDNPGADLDLTLDRGIVTFVNKRTAGLAKVRIHCRGETWTLSLLRPGAKVGLELYARFPPGVAHLVKEEVEEPVTDVILLILKGEAFLHTGKHAYRLTAPPGQAVAHWQSLTQETAVRHLDKLPESIGPLDAKTEKVFEAVAASAQRLDGTPLGAGLDKLMGSEQRMDRLVGVTLAGAVDDLPRVLRGLEDPKHADLRDHAILVLRHWLGRGPEQVGALLAYLRKQPGFTEAKAKTAVQLLFGFDVDDRRQPATYDLLIEYLRNRRLAVRELARWHLVRLVPAGKDIAYDAAAPEPERQRGYEQWRALIPPGQLPPVVKTAPPKKT
jgi:hypothetical protein